MACTSLPVINNGYITAQDGTPQDGASRVEYECLAGFELVGSKVIDCNNTIGWGRAPSCQAIKNDVTFTDTSNDHYTFAPDWWYAFLAVMLCILVIMCMAGFIWCCICKRWGGATIYPMRSNCGERAGIANAENGTENSDKARASTNIHTVETSDEDHNWSRNGPRTPAEKNQIPPASTSAVFIVDDSVPLKKPVKLIKVKNNGNRTDEENASKLCTSNTWATADSEEDAITKQNNSFNSGSPTSQQKSRIILQETNEKYGKKGDNSSINIIPRHNQPQTEQAHYSNPTAPIHSAQSSDQSHHPYTTESTIDIKTKTNKLHDSDVTQLDSGDCGQPETRLAASDHSGGESGQNNDSESGDTLATNMKLKRPYYRTKKYDVPPRYLNYRSSKPRT